MQKSEFHDKKSFEIYATFIKPAFDYFFSFLLIILLLPIIIIIWLIAYIQNGTPVLFCQRRPGKNEKKFIIYKFRTMTNDKDFEGNLLSDSQRLTSFGRFLRKTSLDEIPQLFNVLKGDLSFVGPRPLLDEYLPLYNDFQKQRHYVKPGITGWAQVNGRNSITWEDKFKLDIYYVKNVSLKLDMMILFKTLFKVVKNSDIYNEKNETMEKFKGSKN